MSGYTATARLDSIRIHAGPSFRSAPHTVAARELRDDELVMSIGVPQDPPMSLDDRLHYIRSGWSQMTFFLFDPQSWR